VTEEDPLKRLNDFAQYLPAEDFKTLKTTTLAASVAKKDESAAPASIFHHGRFTAVALTVLACGMSVVF
jgi:hypothetical protein